jgi:RimJ/RimL family protein N-acetyltransferase
MLMLEHAFATLGLHRIALAVFAFNERAIRSYRRCGFALEGRAREAIFRDGRWWDEIQMSVLAEEWLARRQEQPLDDRPTPALAAETVTG